MQSYRKLFSQICLVGVVGVSLAACGGDEGGELEHEEEEVENQESETENEGEEVENQETDIEKSAPLLFSISATPGVVSRGESVRLSVMATDLEGDELSYVWSGPEEWALDATDRAQVVATAPDEPDVNAIFMVIVTDALGEEVSAQVEVSTAPNEAPRIRSATALPTEVLPGETIDLQVDAEDTDGDELSYEWLAPTGWELSDAAADVTTLTVPEAYNSSARIGVVVTDAYGASDQTEVVVSTVLNQGPRISSLVTTRPIADPGEAIVLEAMASHPFEDDLEYTWEVDGGFTLIAADSPANSPTLVAPGQEGAVGTVLLTVTDSAGVSAQSALVVQTRHYQAPIIQSVTAISPVDFGEAGILSVYAEDPEGGSLIYSWSTTSDDSILLTPLSATTELLGGNPGEIVPMTVEVTNTFGKTSVAETMVRIPSL